MDPKGLKYLSDIVEQLKETNRILKIAFGEIGEKLDAIKDDTSFITTKP